jgi:hypothetical protein
MTDSAFLKIDRAAKHIEELNGLLGKTRPFIFVIQTDTKNGKRIARVKKNEAVVDEIALICGDIVHNLRSALDHAYWQIISPLFPIGDRRLDSIQFPFAREAKWLDKILCNRFAHHLGTGFYCAIRKLKPHGKSGGNDLLFLIHDADILDKHKLLIPAIDYTKITGKMLHKQIPDLPITITKEATFSQTIFQWTNHSVPPDQIGKLMPATTYSNAKLISPSL